MSHRFCVLSKFVGLVLAIFLSTGCTPGPGQAIDRVDGDSKLAANNSISSSEVEIAPVVPQATTDKPDGGFQLRIFAWNIESGGNDPNVIAKQLTEIGEYDIIALSEVASLNLKKYVALKSNWKSIDGTNYTDDHLQIIYDSNRFQVIRSQELRQQGESILNNGKYRSPLLVHFEDKLTGTEFQVIHNHLARGKEEFRQAQAKGLREWAREQTLPTIAVGDYNFDFVFSTNSGNLAFKEFLQDNIWKWVRPDLLVDNNWYDPEGDGVDNFPGSMLDFAFVAGPAKDWQSVCNVIVREGDFPDDEKTSDHRPYELILSNSK